MAEHARHVDREYHHDDKLVTPGKSLDIRGSRLKWYDIAKAQTPVPEMIQALARSFLIAEALRRHWELQDDLGFVLLHRCGRNFYFLIVCTWRGSNELWETVYFKENDATQGFSHYPCEQCHKGTFCVWEMGAVWHETQAWSRFLRSPRLPQDEAAYLDARFAGAV